jgi:phosphoribosylformylglycinamidine cyclo-ligase
MTTPKSATAASGVNYSALDRFKRRAQTCAACTDGNSERLGLLFAPWSRGESAAIYDILPSFDAKRIGFCHEGLGTKNLVADAFRREGRASFYAAIARDTLAMKFNDAATLGIVPAASSMHLSVGSSAWFDDEDRAAALAEGWAKGCNEVGAVWCCGETPELQGVLLPEAAELSGATWGPVFGDIHPSRIGAGLAMIFILGTGIHANGLTFARGLAARLPNGYETDIGDGQTYGEALLQPTPLYCRAVEMLIRRGVDVAYGVNITGHGLMKLMRAETKAPLAYVVRELPTPQPIFGFMQRHKGIDDRTAYGSWNMNIGFAVFVPKSQALEACRIVSGEFPQPAIVGGSIESSDAKRVVVEPKGFAYEAHELEVR